MSDVSADLVDRVLDGLAREADLDGIVTASDNWLAGLVGVSNRSVDCAIRQLIDEGRVRLLGRHSGRGGTRVLQLDPSP